MVVSMKVNTLVFSDIIARKEHLYIGLSRSASCYPLPTKFCILNTGELQIQIRYQKMSILSQTLAALGHTGGFMLLEQLDFVS